MALLRRTTVVNHQPIEEQVTSTRTVTNDSVVDTQSDYIVSRLNELVYVIFTILDLFLLTRFILLALGANRVGIVNFIYDLTQPFVAPFVGIFGRTTIYGVGYVEWESIVAILFYAFLAWAITALINLFRTRG